MFLWPQINPIGTCKTQKNIHRWPQTSFLPLGRWLPKLVYNFCYRQILFYKPDAGIIRLQKQTQFHRLPNWILAQLHLLQELLFSLGSKQVLFSFNIKNETMKLVPTLTQAPLTGFSGANIKNQFPPAMFAWELWMLPAWNTHRRGAV